MYRYLVNSLLFFCCAAGLINRNNNIIAASSVKTSALVRQLLAADDVHVPPNADQPGQPVRVNVGLQVAGVQHDRSESDLLILHGFLDLRWENSRLAWDPLQHHNITAVRLPADRVWVPDMTLYNSAFINSYDTRSRAVFPGERQLVSVRSDGTVMWIPRVTFPLSCNSTRNAAGDEVHCAIKLASWTYDASQIDLRTWGDITHRHDYSNLYSSRDSSYRIIDSTAVRNEVSYSCCPQAYPSIDITFTARSAAVSPLRLAWAAFILNSLLIIIR
ncbi:neuronal acetylcholine receptor subunit alpha-2-like isoform X1 [Paramacrobiotus metropolitanus]|uniref:neuronal acetylcholine receptor subunit alpha-2-like isoform X1 n=1 Tax=Paramacrobiotus metropolitanus TaxID=2943436 RepID=UPI0024462CEB|nr:neuronal acetylcholine receptor subunit alpha-2-like isoform X1 [Paramacrobiotus metropolitanus]